MLSIRGRLVYIIPLVVVTLAKTYVPDREVSYLLSHVLLIQK